MTSTTTVSSTVRNHHAWQALWNAAALCGLLSATDTLAADGAALPPGPGSVPAQSAVPGSGSAVTAASSWKPAWLTDVGLTVKESYADNVFMSDVSLPAGVATLNDKSSFITTISPKLGFNFARVVDASGNLEALSLSYAPDFVRYHSLPTENYDAQRAVLAVKGKADAFSYNLDNTLVYVDGTKVAPTYPNNQFNAWATINAYPRHEQLQDRSKLSLQYDWDSWFVRPGASLAYCGMMTEIKEGVAGYQNYCTRYDVNGGVDFGCKLCPDMAVTLGWRYGSQSQEKYSFEANNSDSDYQRVLLGVEGKPLQWLNVQLLGGPDFRSYENIAPVNDHHLATYYGEAVLSAAVTPQDTLTFKYKQFQFVSCLGVKPYFDSSYGLSYGRKITDRFSLEVGARLLEADYTGGNLATSKRDDVDYVLSAGLHYAFCANVAADLGYSASLGRNAQDNIVNSRNHDFNSQEVSLGVQFKY
jgi:opacity protein-like surface antigen